MNREEEATPEQFAESVRQAMAESLGVAASGYSRHDKYELVKRMRIDDEMREGMTHFISLLLMFFFAIHYAAYL